MNVALIRDRLKANLEAVPGLRAHDNFEDDISVPTDGQARAVAVVVPADPFISYPETIKAGICTLRFKITLCASADPRTGQDALDALLSSGTGETGSAVNALIADRTLGDAAQSIVVEGAGDYGFTEIGGTRYQKSDLTVTVTASRS